MGDLARQYTSSTLKRLFALSGNECAEPNCTKRLVAKDGMSIIAKICHIEAASNEGARYNPHMTDEERRHFDNLILLCDEDHTIIDNKANESRFPVLLLKEWKRNHEGKMLMSKLKSNPSLLKDAINAVANINWEEIEEPESLHAFDLREKIRYNALKKKVGLIEEYKSYHSRINTLYEEIEKQGSFKKEKLLRNIRYLYIKVKGKYVLDAEDPLEIIRLNADNIIDDIYEEIYSKLGEMDTYEEDIVLAINLIMVDAFMRCKILEEPV